MKARVIVFVDGQNFFKQAQRYFGDIEVPFENYSPIAIAGLLAANIDGGVLQQTRLYSGRPWAYGGNLAEADWGNTLNKRISHYAHHLGKDRFVAIVRDLAYRPPSSGSNRPLGREKGVDVALAIGVVMGAFDSQFDVAVILSQDRDLSEVGQAVSTIRARTRRWMHLESAFTVPDTGNGSNINVSGLKGTRWRRISRVQYQSCLETNDFRERGGGRCHGNRAGTGHQQMSTGTARDEQPRVNPIDELSGP